MKSMPRPTRSSSQARFREQSVRSNRTFDEHTATPKIMRVLCLLAFATLALSACQTPSAPHANVFQPVTPADGTALLYLFRPALDKVGHSEKPSLLIDDQVVAELGHASYTSVSLKPGRHKLELKAGAQDSPSWNTELEFEVRAAETHYVAIWNRNQPGSTKGMIPVYSDAQTFFFPIVATAVKEIYTNQIMSRSVHLERVDPDLGRFALSELRFVKPQVANFPAMQ